MKKITVTLSLILFTAAAAHAVILKWEIPENERLEMMRTARVNYFLNQKLASSHEERNIIDMTCVSKEAKGSNVKGVFSVFDRAAGQNVFNLREQYHVDFVIAPNGIFTVPEKHYMPNLRNIPSFPDKEINVNEQWSGQGELILSNYSKPFKMIFPVQYLLSEIQDVKGDSIAVIKYAFAFDKDMRGVNIPGLPKRITGHNTGIIKWNVTKNKPYEYVDLYYIIFIDKTGTQEFSMSIHTENAQYAVVPEAEKEKARSEIESELPAGNDDIEVDTDERGIVFRLGEMLFDVDSYSIRPDTKNTLEDLIKIVKQRYPDREIIVEGHTDNTGSTEHNQKLSEQRAKAVAEYLKPPVGHDKFSFRGFGKDKPIAGNDTKEGRQKNRRVEVIIKLN
jgi:outer membrane protein OmpA-like peptidoglycan-associated protein